jgi:guanylate kinase
MSHITGYVGRDEKLLVFVGPSGAGKSTIVDRLIKEGLVELTPSWTTRRERNGQELVSDHIFIDETTFKKLETEGFFLESAQPFGLPYYYGLPKITHDHAAMVPAVVLRTMVLPLLGKHYGNPIIYQIEAPKEAVEQRLAERGSSAEEIQKRMSVYEKELLAGREAADRVFVNDDLDTAYALVAAAIAEDF